MLNKDVSRGSGNTADSLRTGVKTRVNWNWQGPEEVKLGIGVLLYVWKPSELSRYEGGKGYYALRHKTPNRPVQYAATNDLLLQEQATKNNCCLSCSSLDAALYWCESHYESKSGNKVISNRKLVASKDYWELAKRWDVPRQYWYQGEIVPLSIVPDGTEFVEPKSGLPGRLLSVNRNWTAEVQVGLRWEQIQDWPRTTLVSLLHNIKAQKRNYLVLDVGEAKELFYALGYVSADNWSLTRLYNRINSLNQFLSSEDGKARWGELIRGSLNNQVIDLATCIRGALEDGAIIKIEK